MVLSASAVATGVLLAPAQGHAPLRSLTMLLFIGSGMHVASTAWFFRYREIRERATREVRRFIVVPTTLIATTAVCATQLNVHALNWFLLAFSTWQYFHYQKQSLGIAAFGASALNVRSLSRRERRAIVATGVAGIIALVCRPTLLQLWVRIDSPWGFRVAALGFGAVAAAGLRELWRRAPEDRPRAFVMTYATSLLFFLPIFLFSSPYAAVSGVVLAHGLQYLILMGWMALGSRTPRQRVREAALFGAVTIVGGLVLTVASHLHGSDVVDRLLYGTYLGVVMSHFVLDAALWRWANPAARSFLSARLPSLVRPKGLARSEIVTSSADIV